MKQRTLVIRNLMVKVDASPKRRDPVKEAKEVVSSINRVLGKVNGDPVLDFDLHGSADIEAEYTWEDYDA